MTGIAGAFGARPVDANLIEDMARALAHRGSPELRMTSCCAAAGLRRDPATGAGPVIHAEGDLVVLFDGEAHEPRTIAALYREHGPAFLDRLEGPFALVIVDGDRILLARDAVGVRPLYIRRSGGQLLFASEVKALLRAPGDVAVDMDTLLERFVFSDHALGRSTLFRDIHSLAPGTYATGSVAEAGLTTSAIQPGAEADIREVVEQNVRHYLERYRTVGILLSGGFDSSVLACLAQKYARGRVRTFTIGDSEQYPDVRAARQVAKHLGTEHHEYLVDSADPNDLVRGIHAYEDLSYRDTLFILARRMAGLADVALSGSGADLLGNPVLITTPERLPRTLDNWQRLSGSLRDPEQRRIAVYMESFLQELEQDREAVVLRHFLEDYIPNQLIPSTERALSYWGMEAAFPFADRRLMRIAQRIPTAAERTRLLRAAFADLDLPDNIKERPKLCSKQGLIKVKSMIRDEASARPAKRLGGLLRSDFEARCYQLLDTLFVEHRGELTDDVLAELSRVRPGKTT